MFVPGSPCHCFTFACFFVSLTPHQVSLGEYFHAGGVVFRDESPAGAFLDGYHRSALDDVIQQACAVAKSCDDVGERVVVVGGGELGIIVPGRLNLREGDFPSNFLFLGSLPPRSCFVPAPRALTLAGQTLRVWLISLTAVGCFVLQVRDSASSRHLADFHRSAHIALVVQKITPA